MIHDNIIHLAIREMEYRLDAAERRELADHLTACEACRAEVALLRDAHDALRVWGSEPAPPVAAPTAAHVPPATSVGRMSPWLVAVAIIGLILGGAGGYGIGRTASTQVASADSLPADSRPKFTLLLEERADAWPPTSPLMRAGYVEWLDTLVARKQYDGGDRFAEDAGWFVAPGGSAVPLTAATAAQRGPTNYSGYFVIRARDYEEAVMIAKTSPHLLSGGIVVRRSY